MLLVVDNGSVYTERLTGLLDRMGVRFARRSPRSLQAGGPPEGCEDGIILSGRRRNDRLTNAVNSRLVAHAVSNGVKLLGICYGAEILALTLGGTIRRVSGAGVAATAAAAAATRTDPAAPAAGTPEPPRRDGEETVRVTRGSHIADEGSVLRVFESHGFEISRMTEPLAGLASSARCRYEMIQYGNRPIFGTQFHPEMSPDGHGLIERFCTI